MPGIPLAPSGAGGTAHTTAKRAWLGLIRVLIGPDPPPVWRWSSPQERRFGYAALWLVTLALCAANLVGSFAELGQLLLAVPAVAPLPLATRRPMLAWRIGWLALLLVPLVPAAWWPAAAALPSARPAATAPAQRSRRPGWRRRARA